jgi:L-glyceraldehyde reductase
MSLRKTIQLQNGVAIPQIGLGTWQSNPHEVENAVRRFERVYAHR